MLIMKHLSELSEQVILAVGTFDGYHLGHQAVLARAKEIAGEQDVPFAVMTFVGHPSEYLHPETAPKQLMNLRQRRMFCLRYGVDELVEIEFNREFANYSAEDFARQVKNHLVVVGENFTFGRNKQGNFDMFDSVEVCSLLKIDDEVVSSTRVRREIAAGNMEAVHKLLGRDYSIHGEVLHGDARGKFLGFPTANLNFGDYCVPEYGAYIGRTKYGGKMYPAMINVGTNPTFTLNIPRIEAHIIGFEGDLYGKRIRLDFIRKLRNEIKFYNVNDLIKQLQEDKNNTCTYFKNVVS